MLCCSKNQGKVCGVLAKQEFLGRQQDLLHTPPHQEGGKKSNCNKNKRLCFLSLSVHPIALQSSWFSLCLIIWFIALISSTLSNCWSLSSAPLNMSEQ